MRIGNDYVSQIGGNVGWSNLSDIRGKEDISDISMGLDFIRSLRPVEFSLNVGYGPYLFRNVVTRRYRNFHFLDRIDRMFRIKAEKIMLIL